ncbi:putative ATP-dependent RNA helicase SoYb [Wyeomyia smithii]|uniref:putative ATP-dependent RNA helicase SoYb n=1 Tax=Wyeomyia smithii TaxID=174621 RepID=UPI002467C730|nr:putative ATP-dependent RNA helicase SoYb [Wyeomyia smithii]XP_055532469.1 putative ATP-dependent RNA helicase SoYb [Wyeomyia smithii]
MEDATIRITHYINPHMFWYKPVSAYVHNLEEKRFQLAIDEYCEENFRQANADRDYDAFPGETVAVLDFDRNKWCRCIVDEVLQSKDNEKRYRLWAIDDGVPIQSSAQYVNILPQKFSDVSSKVKRGAIKNLLPSECVYDAQADKLVSKGTPRWDSNACNVLQSMIQNSSNIYFRNVTKHQVHNVLVNFGDLEIVTQKDNRFDAARVLTEIRHATEVEPSDFITRLSEIQTMSANRSLANDTNAVARRNKTHSASPMKPRYERNVISKITNGTGNYETHSRDLELNGVDEEDFDESASMIRPNHVREYSQHQPSVEAIAENSLSEEELYPVASTRVQNAKNLQYEIQLWQQKPRPYDPKTIENLYINSDRQSEHLKSSSSSNSLDRPSYEKPKLDESFEKPKSTVSFLTKLELRKKQRAAQKAATVQEEPVQESPSPQTNGGERYSSINIIPAGFNMGNVAFDNGRVVAGDSSDSSERKGKQRTSPNFRPRQQQTKQSPQRPSQSRNSSSDEQHQQQNYRPRASNDFSETNGRVYVSKNASRFDQLIEEEACVRSRLCHQRLLVHGQRVPKPIDRVESANFCPEVHRELGMFNFNSIHRVQTYSWPHILRGNSFFCVNAAGTGKTFAFLPAVCSSVMKMHDEELVAKGAGPMAIIICKSSREVQRVASYCRKMLNSSINKAMVVVEAFGARDITKACNLLLNGCAILVATAPGYRRVFEGMANAFTKERIQCVVIDNIDNIIERFGSELQLLCKTCDKAELQMVVTATYWNPLFFGFLKKYKNMIICIGAYLEAAIYGKSNLVLKLQTKEQKIHEIIRFVKEHDYHNERTLIVCSEASEVYEVVEQLKTHSITHLFCNDQTTLTKMDGFKEWDNQLPGEMHIMVCYDGVLPDLDINKVQHIIHFSLPKSWTMFARRFACSFGYYEDPLREQANNGQHKPASSLILLDENNNEQLPKLVEFLRIHNQEVSEPIMKLTNNIRIQQEEKKLAIGNPIDFCSQVLDFGKCRITGCTKRHVFTTRDLSLGILPSSGIVKLKIYNIFSPTHYTARVLEHRDYGATGWTTVNDAQEFFALDMEIQTHYANEELHCSHGDVHFNDWCIIYDEFRYWRCRIISIEPKKEHTTSRKIKVKLLDIGRTIDCISSELLHMPDEFCRLPAQAIDIRIVGVVPHDFETEWDKRVTLTIREWIDQYTANEKFHVEGKVMLAIRDAIWVDTIRLVEHLDGINTDIHEIHVKSQIVGKNFGVTDKEPLELLTAMVENCEAYRNRTNNAMEMQEDASSDEGIDSSNKTNTNSDTNQFFPNDPKIMEIDKPKTPSPTLLKPMEISDTDSDDCCSSVPAPQNDTKLIRALETLAISENKVEQPVARKRPDFKETYDEIEMETTYEVFISQYYAPNDFYLCRVDKFSFISTMIGNFAEVETNLVPLTDAQVADYCLVLYDNAYQRAKITDIEARDIRVFFLDLGGYDTYVSVDLFELPDDLLKASPFCAIKGEVACLQPREEDSQRWDAEIGDKIYDQVLANYRTFNAKIVEIVTKPHVDPLVHCKSYRLLLFDPDNDLESWIFDEIVELKLARYIDDERPYSVDINFGEDDFRQFLDPNYEPQKKSKDVEEARIEEITETDEVLQSPNQTKPEKASTKLTLLKHRLRKKKSESTPVYPRLKCDFRSPKTIWRQDESLIVIRISSPENVVYDLAVDTDSLQVCYFLEDEKYLLSIVFFAAVQPELTVHEVRGLSIVVRLVKLIPSMHWPSVMRHGDRVPWLQQCIEVPHSDETDATDGMQRAFPTVPNLDGTSDSSEEEPDFSDQFDKFDPIEDDYFMRDE